MTTLGMSVEEDRIPDTVFSYLITHYRWFFVVFFLMPLSLAYDLAVLARNSYAIIMYKSQPKQHAQRVKKIVNQILEWKKEVANSSSLGIEKRMMCTSRPGWQAMSLRAGKYKKTYKNIDIQLVDILDINFEKKTCTVEPMCTMGQITRALIPIGWTLPVVPELDDLTVGGLVAGVGIETSSHIHGLFQHICVGYEVVLPDGSVVKCSAVENTELFQAIPWSHGTLGFVVAVEIQIIPSSPYVRVEYLPFEKKELAMESFIANSRKTDYDFVECLAYSQDHYVVMLGKQVESYDQNNKDIVYNPIGLWYKQWFYLHVKEHLKTMKKATEIIPIRDYYHRHTRSLFWELQDIVPFGNNIVFRYLLGWMMPPKPSLMKLTQTEELRKLYELHHVVQDMLVPINTLSKSLEVFHQEIGIYPLWLCPFRIHESSSMDRTIPLKQGFIHPLPEDNLFVDIGAYGNPTVAGFKAKDTCRRLEDYVRKCKGYQMMYADSYMTKEEFHQMFDHKLYDKLRDSIPLCKEAFPEVYDKVCRAARI